jgi:crossover junction endodeoxyribonuclease RuvC
MKTILAIDPGTRLLGWCVILGDKRNHSLVSAGAEKVTAKTAQDGLVKIFEFLGTLIEKYKPEVVVLETPFYGENTKTLIRLGEARGVILLRAALSKTELAQSSPAEAKIAATGNGNARKEQVAYMVKNIFDLKEDLPLDATDAIAIGLAYLNRCDF